jgi:hypothetical protein
MPQIMKYVIVTTLLVFNLYLLCFTIAFKRLRTIYFMSSNMELTGPTGVSVLYPDIKDEKLQRSVYALYYPARKFLEWKQWAYFSLTPEEDIFQPSEISDVALSQNYCTYSE